MVYKRVRRSCSHKRDQEHFDRCHKALAEAKEAEDKGLINLFYFDESGFSQEPSGALRLAATGGAASNTFCKEQAYQRAWLYESEQRSVLLSGLLEWLIAKQSLTYSITLLNKWQPQSTVLMTVTLW